MTNLPLLFIITCYLILAAVWTVTAFSNKKVSKKSGGWILRLVFYTTIVLFVFLQKLVPFFAISLWPKNLTAYIIADAITFAGLLIMIWARITLGKNWSGNIVIKENHELIIGGPYKYVRHPIYSGLILMVLGVVLYFNTLALVIFFGIFFWGAYYKAKKEEGILTKHFSDNYLEYKKHTKYLIPFIF